MPNGIKSITVFNFAGTAKVLSVLCAQAFSSMCQSDCVVTDNMSNCSSANMKKSLVGLWISIAALVLWSAFIWSNSFADSCKSQSTSDSVIELIQPVLDKLCRGDEDFQSFIVRKGAHFSEFAVLGVASAFVLRYYRRLKDKGLCGMAMFYGLFVGVCDEFIQSFSDRTSSVRDVLIDFFGYMTGAVVAVGIMLMIYKCKKIRIV